MSRLTGLVVAAGGWMLAIAGCQQEFGKLAGRVDESLDEHVRLAQAISQGEVANAERVAMAHMRRLAELRIRMLLEGY